MPARVTGLCIRTPERVPGPDVRVLGVRLLRALLPSWRFFDEIEPAPVLHVRSASPDCELGAWQAAPAPARRTLGALLLNPAGNLALAEHALLEQLVGDLAEPTVESADDVEQLTSYALVANLARLRLALAAGTRFQFKLTLPSLHGGAEELLVSRVH